MEISWNTRQKDLMEILPRNEMNIPASVIDLKLLELDSSSNYDEWIGYVMFILKLATVEGIRCKEQVKPKFPPPIPPVRKEPPHAVKQEQGQPPQQIHLESEPGYNKIRIIGGNRLRKDTLRTWPG